MRSSTQEKWAEGFIQYKDCIECKQPLVRVYKIYTEGRTCTSTARVCVNKKCFHFVDVPALDSWSLDPHFIQFIEEKRLPSSTRVEHF